MLEEKSLFVADTPEKLTAFLSAANEYHQKWVKRINEEIVVHTWNNEATGERGITAPMKRRYAAVLYRANREKWPDADLDILPRAVWGIEV